MNVSKQKSLMGLVCIPSLPAVRPNRTGDDRVTECEEMMERATNQWATWRPCRDMRRTIQRRLLVCGWGNRFGQGYWPFLHPSLGKVSNDLNVKRCCTSGFANRDVSEDFGPLYHVSHLVQRFQRPVKRFVDRKVALWGGLNQMMAKLVSVCAGRRDIFEKSMMSVIDK